ncbi:MAG: hypothetical protein WD824_25210 [Cyclobacteriaceae bacterium]
MKKPSLRSVLLLLPCIFIWQQTVYAFNDSTRATNPGEIQATSLSAGVYRNFEDLSLRESLHTRVDPIIVNDLALSDTILDKRTHAHTLLEKVLRDQRFLESLDALSEIELPIGIVKAGGAIDYSILIDRIHFTKEGAMMDVYVSLALPQTGSRIAFHGVVPLSAAGGISGNAKVFLLGDHPVRLNNNSLITIKGSERSYVEFDCSGFLGVNLDAELEFSNDLIVPEDERGEIKNQRVKANFRAYTQSLNDIILNISLPPFQVKGLTGFGFYVTKAYLDWSDVSNPPEIVFPADYSSPVIRAGLNELWHGIYLQELEVRLPPSFARRNPAERVSVGVQHAIFDDLGFTGKVYAENLIPDGDMNGWGYTLDKLSLELITNQMKGFSLEGKLTIPVVKGKDGKRTQFKYIALRGAEGDYIFSVQVEDELKLDLWLADVKLMKGSSVIVTEKENKFYPSAQLSGELTINFSGKGPKASFNSIRFENMIINSEAPYFQPGTFGFGREGHNSSISKYPVVFDNITLKSEDLRVGIAFDLIINISGKPEDESFAGKAGLVVWGMQDDAPLVNADGTVSGIDRLSWKFDKVELTSVKINIKKPRIIELAGEIRFYDEDATYGEGFKGTLKGTIQSIKVQAHVLFGKTETFRYWYADALVELKEGIPIVPGVLSAFGFGGGYYSKMKQSSEPVSTTLGRSPSGITYVPDENALGIRAIVLIGTPRPEAMKGDVALEVSLNRHGGINSVTFTGNANFMSAASLGADQIRQLASAAVAGNLTEKLSSLTRGQVYGSVRLYFDNVNDVFHGNLEVYVNVAGGIVRGVSEGNKAGWAELHFEKNDWYVHIGTPDQPLGLEVARIFKSKSYFMIGKNLPGSPPPPSQVTEILGDIDLDYMRDMNALESGMGIAFGLHFLVDTGDLRFLMFYGRFSAGTGLDFMLKDYGNEYHCAGSSGPIGINGWYANGQAYAFVMGKIGIKVNLRFYKGTYEILGIGAAAVLQAKGPNPFWMKGTVGGYYKILGGLVKGKCRFEVTVGKDCKPVGEQNLLEDVNMIAEMTPPNSSTDVNVFNTPQVAFNIPVGEIFEITDLEKKTHYFRAVLDEFVVSNGSKQIDGNLEWNEEKDVVIFNASDLLPGNKKLRARAKLTFEEKVNGLWTKVRFDGKIVLETTESNFETGEAPGFIPESNIAYSYPLPNQINFYPQEYPEGLIQLAEGQPYLFNPGKEWLQKIRMTEVLSGQFIESELAYNQQGRLITFPIPGGFQNSKLYRFEVVNIPRVATVIDQNVAKINKELAIDQSAGTATITTQSIEGDLNLLETKPLYISRFRTSKYNTFIEKLQRISLAPSIRLNTGINIFQLTSYLIGDEDFEESELSGSSGLGKLITMEAVTENNGWYENYVHPLIYDGYPLLGWMKVGRLNPYELGVPPVRDIYVENTKPDIELQAMREQSLVQPFSYEYIVYNLGQSVAADFRDMQRHAVNYVADNPTRISPRLESLVIKPMPHLRYGAYRVKLNYLIPGINKVSSSYEVELFNRIPDND